MDRFLFIFCYQHVISQPWRNYLVNYFNICSILSHLNKPNKSILKVNFLYYHSLSKSIPKRIFLIQFSKKNVQYLNNIKVFISWRKKYSHKGHYLLRWTLIVKTVPTLTITMWILYLLYIIYYSYLEQENP